MRVIVAGAGIGGLACAQGLTARGIETVVVEPDADLSVTGGYKLHLGPPAVTALRDLLPAGSVARLFAAAVVSDGFRIDVRDHRARLLVRVADAAGDVSVDIDRVTLRLILAAGLTVRTGRRCVSWTAAGDTVTATLDDGTTLTADVLVVADGADSALVRPLAGGPTAVPTGMVGVAGRTPWPALDPRTRELFAESQMLAIGPGGVGLFGAAHTPSDAAIWGLIAVADAVPGRRSGPALRDQADRVLARRRWAPVVRRLVRSADPGSIAAFRLWGSDPRRLAPWPAGRVTALGDAVHAMPPTGGRGAATAVLDAASLVSALAGAGRDGSGVAAAIGAHEARMRAHAAGAVRESLQPLGWIRASAHPAGAALTRVALPAAAALAATVRTLRAR